MKKETLSQNPTVTRFDRAYKRETGTSQEVISSAGANAVVMTNWEKPSLIELEWKCFLHFDLNLWESLPVKAEIMKHEDYNDRWRSRSFPLIKKKKTYYGELAATNG